MSFLIRKPMFKAKICKKVSLQLKNFENLERGPGYPELCRIVIFKRLLSYVFLHLQIREMLSCFHSDSVL